MIDHDAAGRVVLIRYLDANGVEQQRISNTWDSAANGAGQIGLMVELYDATLSWRCSALGRVSSLTAAQRGHALSLGAHLPDTDDRLQSLTYPPAASCSWLRQRRARRQPPSPYQIANQHRPPPFPATSRPSPCSTASSRQRGQDTNGWPQGYTLGEQPLAFGYDLAGRITGLDQNGTAYDQGFGYDAADRLTSYTGYPALRAYTYDANANRTSETLGAMLTSITHMIT
ncbi:MAG: hypothetical protein R3E34_10320 [Rhodocyclaceae bacterium]